MLPSVWAVVLACGWSCAGTQTAAVRGPSTPALASLGSPEPGGARAQSPQPEPAATLTQTAVSVASPNEKVLVKPLARVNNRPILENEVREATSQELLRYQEPERTQRYQQIRLTELQRLIERELILADMEEKVAKSPKKGILTQLKQEAGDEFEKRIRDYRSRLPVMTDEEFKQFLAAQDVSLDGMKRQVERNYMMTAYVRSIVGPKVQRAVKFEDMRAYYQAHADEYSVEDRVVWQDIFVPAAGGRQLAEQVLAKARAGTDFPAILAEYNTDGQQRMFAAGFGEKRGEVRPADAEPILFALQPGQVGPLIELGSGFHVVKLTQRDHAGTRPFTDAAVQADIRKKLQNQLAEREYRRVVDDLKRRAAIEILVEE
jgi:parvulin-like peptidyl-prolyl isomerase